MFPDGVLYVALANVDLKPFPNSLLCQFFQCGVGGSSHYVNILSPLNSLAVFAFSSLFTVIETSQGQDFVPLSAVSTTYSRDSCHRLMRVSAEWMVERHGPNCDL